MRNLLRCLALPLGVGACGDDGGSADVGTDGESSTSVGTSDERTLDSCSTNVDAEVPEFYAKYFRCVDIAFDDGGVAIQTQNLPPHRSYYYGEGHSNFEAFDTDRGPEYTPNPNTLAEKDVGFWIPRDPMEKGVTIDEAAVDGVVMTSADEYGLGPVGVALDSVALFNPLAAPGDDIEDEKYVRRPRFHAGDPVLHTVPGDPMTTTRVSCLS